MAKTIKFNLICNDKPIRTIEDLQNNFSIEDILTYYNNKLLHRWLSVRGYSDELEKVSVITYEKPLEIIKELIKIFKVETDEKKIAQGVYMLEHLEERKELCAIYDEENYKIKSIIDDYETGYKQLVDEILDNSGDIAKIKANVSEMVANYKWILKLNHRNLFYVLINKSKLAIMCLIMNEDMRDYYLPSEVKKEDGTVTVDMDTDVDKKDMFAKICEMIYTPEFKEELGDNLISFAGITDGYWKDIETKDKKYMVISMESGDYVRSAGQSGGDLAGKDVKNKFVILDGIDYKSNYATHQLLYMEV